MEFSGLDTRIVSGILVKDGWIEYGADKYPDLDAWTLKVFKEYKRKKKGIDCWETVNARSHPLAHFRDQFLTNRKNYHEKKQKRAESRSTSSSPKKGKPKHSVPGRNRLVQQDPTQDGSSSVPTTDKMEDEDEEVVIDDVPVLPHKKRKLSALEQEKKYDLVVIYDVLIFSTAKNRVNPHHLLICLRMLRHHQLWSERRPNCYRTLTTTRLTPRKHPPR